MARPAALLTSSIALLACVWASVSRAEVAPCAFLESFDEAGEVLADAGGPSGLEARGWRFVNRSRAAVAKPSAAWRAAVCGQAATCLVSTTAGSRAMADAWAILPVVESQRAGDLLELEVAATGTAKESLEVRYSPDGTTDLGVEPRDPGAFTEVLLEADEIDHPWLRTLSVAVPGNGRIALRRILDPGLLEQTGATTGGLQIGEIRIGAPTPSELLADETWTAEDNPHVISSDMTIPPGHTVVLEPGVQVVLQNGARLIIDGAMTGAGNEQDPITFDAAPVFPTRIIVGGELQLGGAVVDVLVEPTDGGTLMFSDTTFVGNGNVTTVAQPTYIWMSPPFLFFEHCTFNATYLWTDNCQVRVEDTTIQNEFCGLGDGYSRLRNLTVDASPSGGLWMREVDHQSMYLDELVITNSAGGGLDLVSSSVQIGPNVALLDNLFPLQLGGVSVLPGSHLPLTGNTNDWINVASAADSVAGPVWADIGLPYVVAGEQYGSSSLTMLPGVTMLLGPNTTFWGYDGARILGTPDDPVTIEQFQPGLRWQGLQHFKRIRGAVIEGGDIGARFHSSNGGAGFVDDSTIRNCEYGIQNNGVVRKTRFVDNEIGSWNSNWPAALNGTHAPNSFEGNTLAVDPLDGPVDAVGNWWGAPSGPAAPDNPGGTGDPVLPGVVTVPFLEAPPDFDDHLPVVDLKDHYFLLEPGSKVIFHWDASDDGNIVSQRIEYDHPLEGVTTLADDLPPWRRSFEWLIPDPGFIVNNSPPTLRVTAIDDAGQEGWDETEFLVTTGGLGGSIVPTTDLLGPFRAGDEIGTICWDTTNGPIGSGVTATLILGSDHTSSGIGATWLDCTAASVQMPFASSDNVRLVLVESESLNHTNYWFSEPFTVRPDDRFEDAPPEIALISPADGSSYAGGDDVPIIWTSTDDEALRGFEIQASYDGGRTWHVIADDLPATASSFDWSLPTSTGIEDVRVSVIAFDLRFQNSSAGRDVVFSITPGNAVPCSEFPAEVGGVAVDSDGTTLTWLPGAVDETYDVARGELEAMRSGQSPSCMVTGLTESSYDDGEQPPPGVAWGYLIRASNACGDGPWGSGSDESPRNGSCP